MINTLSRIGNIVKNDINGKVKYHPLIRNFDMDNKDTKKTQYDIYEININTIDKTLYISGKINPSFVKVLKYDVGGNNFPYIIGNYEYINNGKQTQNKILSCLNILQSLNITDQLFIDCGTIIDNNKSEIQSIIDSIQPNYGLILNIKIDEQEFYENVHIMDIIDETYINNITETTNNGLILKNQLFGFFKTNGKISQSPNFTFGDSNKSLSLSKEKLNDLIYSVKFHETKLKYIINDYMFTYLPNFDSLTYSILDDQITQKTLSKVTDNITNTRSGSIMPSVDDLLNCGLNDYIESPLKDDVSFDIIFKLKGGQTTNDICLLRNYKLTTLEKLNNKVNDINRKLSTNGYNVHFSIRYAFNDFFKKETESKTSSFGTFINRWIIDIFNNNYYNNPFLNNIFILKMEYTIRNKSTSTEIKNEYSKLIKNYKFLKYMEKNGEVEEIKDINTDSYKLGHKLGVFCQTWQNDRVNLIKYIDNFNGQISRRIRNMRDINTFFIDVVERLKRNKSYFSKSDYTEIESMYDNFNGGLDTQLFIKGYFSAQYSYDKKEIKEKVTENN